ncbi:MAG: hypothetical protein R2939_01545 [Kofleriaceae bacterium]
MHTTGTKTLAALAVLLFACGDDGGSTPRPDSAPRPDAAPGTPDAADSPDAEPGTPDAMPTDDTTVFVRGDYAADNDIRVGRFVLGAAASPVTPTQVTTNTADDFSVSADGSRIAYSSGDALRAVDADGTDDIEVLATGGGDITDVAISPDGTTIAFRSDRVLAGMYDIYVIPAGAAAGTPVKVSPDRVVNDANADAQFILAWSPDSRYLAYGGEFTTLDKNELHVWDTMTSTRAVLIGAADILAATAGGQPTPGLVLPPVFAPGGKVIALARIALDGVRKLYRGDVGAAGATLMTNGNRLRGGSPADVYTLALSNDGDTLAFATDDVTSGAFEVYTMPSDDSAAATRVTDGARPSGSPSRFDLMQFSPDDAKLAFNADWTLDEKYQPYVIVLATPTLRRLAIIGDAGSASQDSTAFGWTADSAALVFAADDGQDNVAELYTLPITASDETNLVPVVEPPTGGDVFDVVTR